MPPDPLILGFDTSAAHCAAALLSGDKILAHRREEMTKGQAERLMPLLEEMLAEAGHRWSDLAAIGVGVGPGNFTGVRIAVSAARGLALGLEIPAVGVTALEAAAFGQPRPVLACLPAPREQVYLQEFAATVTEPQLTPLTDLPPSLPRCTGPAAEAVAARTGAQIVASLPVAEAIARIAATRWQTATEAPKPLYLRPPDAALPSEPPVVILDDA